jgi:hypothetical protein
MHNFLLLINIFSSKALPLPTQSERSARTVLSPIFLKFFSYPESLFFSKFNYKIVNPDKSLNLSGKF